LYDQRIEREGTYIGKVRFKGVADAGEVSRHRLWVDVVTHEDSEETESFGSRVNRMVMEMAEGEIRVGSRII